MYEEQGGEGADRPGPAHGPLESAGGGLSRLFARPLSALDGTASAVPPVALLLSLLCLAIPVIGSGYLADTDLAEVGLLVWILPLVPPFLLSYYRGWSGAATALAGGMAAFSLGHAGVILLGLPPLPFSMAVVGVVVLVVVSVGSGLLSSILHRALTTAREQAYTDPRTGLPNRRYALLHLQRMFAAAERGRIMSVVMFDIDQLDAINERHGRKEGDRVLKALAGALEEATRTMNLSARVGGDEFMSILDGVTSAGAEVFVERVLEKFGSARFSWGAPTLSAGIAQYEDGMSSPEVLLAAADQGLYRAKSNGGNRWVRIERQGRIAASSEVESRASGTGGDAPGAGETILVVDDDPAVLHLLGKVLMREGYLVLEATSPSEALAYRSPSRRIDLVVTDIVMPEMSGFRLVEVLREQRPDVRVLYISGYGQDEIQWAGVPGTAKGFLSKPLEPKELLRAVRGVLDRDVEAAVAEHPADVARQGIRLRGDAELVAHLTSRLREPSLPFGVPAPGEAGYDAYAGAPDILVVEDLSEETLAGWEDGSAPLPDLVVALNMTWSGRIRALEAGVIDVLPHDMLAGELEARVAGAIKRRRGRPLAPAVD